MAPLTKNEKKKHPLLPMRLINGFEKSCGTFRRKGGKNPLLSHDIGLVCLKIKIKINIKIKNKKTMTMGWMLA